MHCNFYLIFLPHVAAISRPQILKSVCWSHIAVFCNASRLSRGREDIMASSYSLRSLVWGDDACRFPLVFTSAPALPQLPLYSIYFESTSQDFLSPLPSFLFIPLSLFLFVSALFPNHSSPSHETIQLVVVSAKILPGFIQSALVLFCSLLLAKITFGSEWKRCLLVSVIPISLVF